LLAGTRKIPPHAEAEVLGEVVEPMLPGKRKVCAVPNRHVGEENTAIERTMVKELKLSRNFWEKGSSGR